MKVVERWMTFDIEDFRPVPMALILANWINVLSSSKNVVEKKWAKYLKKMWDATPLMVDVYNSKLLFTIYVD